MKISIEITDCKQCPNCKIDRVYTADSFEQIYMLSCKKQFDPQIMTHKVISSYSEWNDKDFVPEWCPQKISE